MNDLEKVETSVKAIRDLIGESDSSNNFIDGQLNALDAVLRIIEKTRGGEDE